MYNSLTRDDSRCLNLPAKHSNEIRSECRVMYGAWMCYMPLCWHNATAHFIVLCTHTIQSESQLVKWHISKIANQVEALGSYQLADKNVHTLP